MLGRVLCKTLASWALCQFKMTNKWHQGVPTCQDGGIASLHPTPPPPNTPPSVDARAWLCVVACDSRSHVYPCKLMCVFTPFVGSVAPSPTLKPPASLILLFLALFSPSVCSTERRLGSVKTYPFFCLHRQFFCLFLVLRWLPLKFTQPWHPMVFLILKRVEAEVFFFFWWYSWHHIISFFHAFISWRSLVEDLRLPAIDY